MLATQCRNRCRIKTASDAPTFEQLTEPTSFALSAVWGSSASDLFAVGASVAHYDGIAWSEMANDALSAGLADVWGNSSADVFAVGADGTILHYGG